MQVFNENVHEVSAGRDYRIDFRSGELALSLHIRLGKSFPAEKPEVYVEPSVFHPWVDPLGKVDSPGLRKRKEIICSFIFVMVSWCKIIAKIFILHVLRYGCLLGKNQMTKKKPMPVRYKVVFCSPGKL